MQFFTVVSSSASNRLRAPRFRVKSIDCRNSRKVLMSNFAMSFLLKPFGAVDHVLDFVSIT